MPATITVGEIIDESRDFHRTFDPKSHPDKALTRQITRAERDIVQKVTKLNENALAEEVTFRNLSLGLIRGLDLPAFVSLNDIVYDREDVRRPVALVDYSDRMTEGLRRFPAAYLIGNKLYPVNRTQFGETLEGWDEIDLIRVTLVKLPPKHESLSELISLPDIAHGALVANLAHWMSLRPALPETNLLYGQAQAMENTLVENLSSRSDTSSWQVRVTHYV